MRMSDDQDAQQPIEETERQFMWDDPEYPKVLKDPR
jgi:hypothetical protein